MSDLRTAAQQVVDERDAGFRGWPLEKAIDALKAALAEPVQEPVAWRVLRSDGQYELYFVKASAERAAECYISRTQVEPLYTHPAPQRQPQKPVVNQQMTTEPVAKVEVMTTGGNAGLATRIVEIDDHLRERLRPGQMLYTHPAPQRQPQDDPVAWMHPDDGRVIPAATMKIAVQDGGASLSSVRGYTIPLGPLRQPLTADETMHLMNETAGHYWADEAHIQRFRAAVEKRHGIGGQE